MNKDIMLLSNKLYGDRLRCDKKAAEQSLQIADCPFLIGFMEPQSRVALHALSWSVTV
jgi:hypothetical protein